ncbi:hypothetical protein HY256_11360, partial [Candidatus Sumerlaeota bacterium]|nr:hypothetical protein [Candidatus Sumerlaeota bacterium]
MISFRKFLLIAVLCCIAAAHPSFLNAAEKKKIVLVAGTPSHGPGEHEFNAGITLIKKCLENVESVQTTAY